MLSFVIVFLIMSQIVDGLAESIQLKKWHLSGGDGGLETDPITGEKCLTVTGIGHAGDSNYWTLNYSFASGQTYKLSCKVRRSAGTNDGQVLIGTNFANFDNQISEYWEDKEFIVTPPDESGKTFLRLGQWHVNGKVWFRDIKVIPVQLVHQFNNEYFLGSGESIKNGLYRARFINQGFISNTSRFLLSYKGYFNTYRWDLHQGDYVIFHHRLKQGQEEQISGSFTLDVGYYRAGTCHVSVSLDGNKWDTIGHMKSGRRSFEIPSRFLPAKEIFVRVMVNGLLPRLQIDNYEYQAQLSSNEASFIGNSRFIEIEKLNSELDVKILSMGDNGPEQRSALISITNRSRRNQDFEYFWDEKGETRKTIRIPSSETKRIRIPLSNKNPYQLKNLTIRRQKNKKTLFSATSHFSVPYLHRTDYGHFVGKDEHAILWWTDATRKISRVRAAPENSTRKEIKVYAARNEYEPFQLMLKPQQDIKNIRIKTSPLRYVDGFSKQISSITTLLVDYVPVTYPTDAMGSIGDWPDPLPPIQQTFSVKKDQNQPIWVLIYVPSNVSAGEYIGEIQLEAGSWSYRVPFRLHVWDFTLPEISHLQSAFGFQPVFVGVYHHFSEKADIGPVLNKYFKSFAEHRISPYNPFVLHEIKQKVDKKSLKVKLDFCDFDAIAERNFTEYGFNSFRLQPKGLASGTFLGYKRGELGGFAQGSQEYRQVMFDYLRQLHYHLREKKWLDKAYIYWFDEPQPKDYPIVKETMDLIHQAAPDLTRMVTEQPVNDLYGYVDLWCPVTWNYDHEIAEKRRAQGERFWWYICTTPKAPYCTLFIDHPAVNLRTWIWQAWKYNIEGILIWQSNYWSSPVVYPEPQLQNPYTDPMSYHSGYGLKEKTVRFWGNGDGRFLYPPKAVFESAKQCDEGPVSSIRWEMLREGMEDYEYLWLLRDLVNKVAQKRGNVAEVQAARELLTIPANVTTSLIEFSTSPEPIYEHRTRLAKSIELLQKELQP